MARDWSREPYRKLLLRPSRSFLVLDALAQGIGYVLSREADDEGYLPFATSFDEGLKKLWKIVNVPPRQRSIVVRCLQDLITDGMVRHVGDRLFVKNLRDINERREYGPKGSPRAGNGNSRANAEPTLSEPRANAERTVSERSADAERTSGEPSADRERHAAEQSKQTQVRETTDGDSPSRARSQVGREVGRKADPDQRERQRLPPAPDDHPLTELIASNEAIVFGVPPGRLAAGVISVAAGRSEADQIEAVERALTTTARQLATKGLDDPPRYFMRCAQKLLARGGLEAARTEEGGTGGDDPYELLNKSGAGS